MVKRKVRKEAVHKLNVKAELKMCKPEIVDRLSVRL